MRLTTEQVRQAYSTAWDQVTPPDDVELVREQAQLEFDLWLRKLKAEVWVEGRKAKWFMFGHYHDCCGWEDCHCETYINPYTEDGEGIVAFCGDLESHGSHDVPARGTPDSGWQYLPEFTCPGFFQCDECYEVEYTPQPHHVCQEEA